MTCFYLKKFGNRSRLDRSRRVNIITDFETGKILQYSRSNKAATKITLSADMLKSYSRTQTMMGIEDPSITICSELVPSLFSDNFDYGSQDHLIQGIIEHEDLLACSLHAHIITKGYAAKISSFSAYQEVCDAYVRRWNYPAVPERSSSSHIIRYQFDPMKGSYFDSSAKFDKKSLGQNVVLDAGTEVDPRSRIKNTVVGKHCTIKENVSINDSFIMSNVLISQGCILDTCFVGANVKLLPGVHLEPGVVVASNVVLGPNLKVDRSTRLSSHPSIDSFTGQATVADHDSQLCGKEGKAYVYEREEESSSKEGIEWGAIASDVVSEEPSDSTSVGDSDAPIEEEEEVLSDTEKAEMEFSREVNDSLLNGLRENYATENIILEINSSRHAYNICMDDVLSSVAKGILHVGEDFAGSELSEEELWVSMQKGLVTYADVLRNYIKKPKDQIVLLNAIEEFFHENSKYLCVVQKTLYELNQELEILDDEIICYWFSKGGNTDSFGAIAKSISKFVTWLDEDSDDDEDEGSDDED